MGKFCKGDLVVATKEMRTFCDDSVIKKGDKGVVEGNNTTFIGGTLVGVKFKNFYGFCPENNLEKINEEPKMEEKKEVKFNFGDKVRAKHDIENMLGTVKKGAIGLTVLSDPRHKEWAKVLFGKELYTFDFDGITVHTDSEDVEKIEPEEKETTKPENLRKYHIELKGKPPLIFVGTFDKADNESRYFSTPEGVEYEVKEDLIEIVSSEKA